MCLTSDNSYYSMQLLTISIKNNGCTLQTFGFTSNAPKLNEPQVINLNFIIFRTVCSTNQKAVNSGHLCAVWTVLVTATVLYRL